MWYLSSARLCGLANTGGSISDNVIFHCAWLKALLTCGLVTEGKSFKMFVCLEGGWMKLSAESFWMKCLAIKLSSVVASINLLPLGLMRKLACRMKSAPLIASGHLPAGNSISDS